MLDNPVKDKLERGETVFGTFAMEFNSPGLARIVAGAGADFIILDMEHSGWSFETIKLQAALARGAGLVPIANPRGEATYQQNELLLDLGALGIMVPRVETGAQAEAIVRGTRYPPDGGRGAAFGFAHDHYQIGDVSETIARENARTLVTVKIETKAGIENIGDILAVPGLDVAFIGHTDLSLSLGIPFQFDSPEFAAALDRVLAAAREHGKAAGVAVGSPEQGRAWIAKGFTMIAYSEDVALLGDSLRDGIEKMRG